MSCFDVQILDPNINTIEIETCIGDQPSSIDILTYDNTSIVEINHCVPLLSEIVDILPVQDILAGSGISVSDNSGIYTISLSNPTIYSSGIVDFLEAVQDVIGNSGLVAGNYINVNYNDSTGYTTISATGLQPSGNYSVVGHNHISSNITDFSSSVSGLLPVKNISAGSGIGIVANSGNFTVSVTGTFGLTGEEVDDRVSNLLIAGNYINLNYSDLSNNLTVSVTGLQPSGDYSVVGHTHNVGDIINFANEVSGLLPNTYDAAVPWTANHTLVDGTRYLAGDLVYANGRLYKANYDNESIPVSSTLYWTDVGPGYRLNIDGRDIPNIPYPVTSVNGHSGVVELSTLDLDDFNSAVSGLIPPSNFTSLTGLSGIIVSNSGTDYYVSLVDPTIQLTDITDLSSNARTFLLTPSSNNLQTLISDETGSGTLVFNNSPAFSGTPTVPTAPSGTNTTQIASTAFVRTEISNLIDSAPSTLDTLNELAAALGDDPNFATTITNTLAGKANLSGAIFTGPVTIPSGTGNFNSLTVNGINVSISGHAHTSSDITNFNSSVSGLLPTISNSGNNRILTSTGSSVGINAENNLRFENTTLSIGSPSGAGPTEAILNLYSNDAGDGRPTINFKDEQENNNLTIYWSDDENTASIDTHFNQILSLSAINEYNLSWVRLALDPTNSGIYSNSNIYINDIPVSISGHNHTSSNITDFNSSVSGLLPVKNIVGGSGISVSSVSGEYTIATTGNFGLTTEEVDDRVSQLLVAGTGVNLTYNDASGTLTIDNLHSEINVLSQEPQGFVNRDDSLISFDDSSRTFTIQPAVSGGSYTIYAEGVKVVKSGVETVVLASGTALNYIHFDTTPPYSLHTKTTGFNFDTDIPIAFIHWNSDINQSTFFGEERHGIRMDSVTHKWIHNTFGMQYISGLSIGGYVLLGNGSSNSHAQIDISDGVLYQEDIIIDVTNGSGTGEFIQPLSPIAYIPVYYHSGLTGQWVRDAATAFPVKYNATRAQYNLYSGGTWTTPNVPNNRYFAMWIVATNDMNDPILAIMGQREDSSLSAAESNNNWGDINLTNIPTQELRPLYRLIFVTNDTFTNTPKSSLQSILDIRTSIQSVSAGVTQNDHGSLFGLADDDHSQYVHIDNARTIDAVHTFTNGLNASGLINAASGNFTSLTVNSTGVSLVGHTHTSSNITDFNSGVSGLLPSVTGTGYVNTSFNSNLYTISVTGLQPSGNYANATHTHTSSDITNFNSSVSGLLPTISNSGDNRLLTSTGSSVGINAENNLTFDGSTLNVDGNLVFDSFTESVVAIGNSSTSQTLSLASGTVQTCTLTGNCTFTMPTATAGKSFTLFLNSGSGNYTASFSGVLWSDSAPPTITTTASKVDILSFISDGSYWYGSYSQNYG